MLKYLFRSNCHSGMNPGLFLFFLFIITSPVCSEGAGLSSQGAPGPEEIRISNEKTPYGKTVIKAIFRIRARPETVYQTLRDATRFAEFIPYAQKIKVLESGPGYQIIRLLGSISLWKSNLIMKQSFDDTERRISWTLIKGRPKAVDGFLQVEAERDSPGTGSLVTYINYVDAGSWVPEKIVSGLLRNGITEMVANLRQRVSGGGIWISDRYQERVP